MTLSITDDRITSGVTPHTAYRHPSPVPSDHGWIVSWLPGRVIGHSLAISAMMIAELVTSIAEGEILIAEGERRLQINDLAHELGMSGDEAIRLVLAPIVTAEPAPVHDTHAIPAGDEPDRWYEVQPVGQGLIYSGLDRDAAAKATVNWAIVHGVRPLRDEVEVWATRGGVGDPTAALAVMNDARVALAEAHQAALEAELEQLEQAAEAKRDAKRARLAALADSDCERCEGSGLDPDTFTTTRRADGLTVHHLTEPCRDCIDEKLVPCPYCGALVEPEVAAAMVRLREATGQDAPAKTHDLWVRKQLFGTLVAAESETDDRRVFILAGSALDLGRVLAVLTPAQIALLIDDLTGGEK